MIIPPNERIIEKKICPISGGEFFVTDKDLEFYDKVSPIFNGKKYGIPSPTLCPEERQRRRFLWRNERALYRRKCDGSGKEIISIYNDSVPFPVYSHEYFFSDQWSIKDYGRNMSFDTPFFDQFKVLQDVTPHILNYSFDNENSEFGNLSSWNKNCYMCFEADNNIECYFTDYSYRGERLVDCSYAQDHCHDCYDCVDINTCSRLYFSRECERCQDSYFLFNCVGCSQCFGGINLRNAQFVYFGKQLSGDEYKKQLRSISLKNASEIEKGKKYLLESRKNYPQKNCIGTTNENCIGDYLFNSKNAFFSFDSNSLFSCKYTTNAERIESGHDIDTYGGTEGCQYVYECYSVGRKSHSVAFSCNVYQEVQNSFYCHNCSFSDSLFGCISVNKGRNMILNKPYSRAEYETLCGKIIDHMRSIGEWGEFFSHELSPFGYNETVAQEYFPMTESEVRAKGWNWYTEPVKTFEGNSIQPLSIDQYDEKVVGFEIAQKNIDILLNGVIKCEVTGKPFKIIRQELAFYIENGIPIPIKHPDQRHKERMALRNPRKLFERHCAECSKDIVTTYAPERPEKVVCEECYRKLVY